MLYMSKTSDVMYLVLRIDYNTGHIYVTNHEVDGKFKARKGVCPKKAFLSQYTLIGKV